MLTIWMVELVRNIDSILESFLVTASWYKYGQAAFAVGPRKNLMAWPVAGSCG